MCFLLTFCYIYVIKVLIILTIILHLTYYFFNGHLQLILLGKQKKLYEV